MKNIARLTGLALLSVGLVIAVGGDFTSHTFFSARPWWEKADPLYESLWRNDRMIDADCGVQTQVAIWGSESTEPQRLARFFMPFGKTTLNVVEFKSSTITPDGAIDRDVEARNFNIETVNSQADDDLDNAFRSRISFCPKQKVVGVGLAFKKALCRYEDGYPKIWFEMAFPILSVRNDMHLTETVLSTGGGPVPTLGLDNAPRVGNMIQAFRQENWNFGRINGPQRKRGIGDVQLIVGWNYINNEHCHYNAYAGLIAPTGNRPQGRYMFEPIVGNNHHVGVMWGNNLGFEAWCCGDHTVNVEFDWCGRYLFRNRQVRSFDLFRSEWSRFLAVYASEADAQAAFLTANPNSGTSGINVFTRCMLVSPRFSANFNTAFIYNHCNWQIEGGWNFYARQAEKVELDSFPTGVQIQSVTGLGDTNLAKTITNNFTCCDIAFSTATYQGLRLQDINLESAAHPAVLSYIIYLTAGRTWDHCCHPTFVGLGGSYEFGSVNTTMHRWTVWGKFGVSF